MTNEPGAAVCWMDPMTRVYPDRSPVPDAEAGELVATAGGCAAVLVAIPAAVKGAVRVHFDGWSDSADWPAPTWFRLLDVAVDGNMGKLGQPQAEVDPEHLPYLERQAPYRVHEILEPAEETTASGERTEAFLALFEPPADARPGRHEFAVTVSSSAGEETLSGSLTVHAGAWPRPQRLGMTNWIACNRLLYPYPDVEADSPRHWALIEEMLTWLRRGGQNTILLRCFVDFHKPRFPLVRPEWRDDGSLHFDFSRFDRLAELALSLGFERLEGGHLGHKRKFASLKSDLDCQHLHTSLPRPDGSIEQVPFDSSDARSFLGTFVAALREHLEARGWSDRYLQHVADEPFHAVAESYLQAVEWVREQLPGIPIIDAASTHGAAHVLDIPVPESDYLDPHLAMYQRLAAGGKEVWFYTCNCPAVPWLNRFLDFPLNHGGLLAWVIFRYGLKGYLHWGANQWVRDLSRDHCPSNGDGWILFPGAEGPLPTLRWLALRLGVEDHELLCALSERGEAAAAQRICERLVRNNTDYTCDTATVRAVRAELRQAVAHP